jgi:predicted dehydrogenase
MIMNKVKAILIGAGARGMYAYGQYALEYPEDIQFVAVADPDPQRRDRFKKLHDIDDDMCFSSWEEILDKPRLADAALICTQDKMHFEPTLKALEKNYHVLLEKPMSTSPKECKIMGEYANKYNRVFTICHVLRYAGFFGTLKQLIDEDKIGRLISIQHNENIGYMLYGHSYVRGNWCNSDTSGPMILSKSSHDMDILLWLAGADCVNISSFPG